MANSEPLRLFWWKATPNFGDALSPLIVAQMSGRSVVHARPGQCDILALGSLLKVMQRNHRVARADGTRPVIWGAGVLQAIPTGFVDHVDIALVRGPVTAALLGLETNSFGDPGLLADRLLADRPSRQDRIAFVPHHSMMDDPDVLALANTEAALDLIGPETDPLDVCARIASARHVVSASLHGLVLADAFGVPSTWLSPGTQSRLKYHDYAASIGRPLIAPVNLSDVTAVLRSLSDNDRLEYQSGIDRARSDLLTAFPAHLCAEPHIEHAPVRA
ncbi:MAG: polysaccharide pyruvyl transferase family protein [Pseudomonadota bacterium]